MAKKKTDEPIDSSKPEELKSAPKVNDISRPGETPAPATSRPVITGHGPMLKQDPMVSGKEEETDINEDKPRIVSARQELKLTPDSDRDESETTEKTEKEDKPAEPLENNENDVKDSEEKPAESEETEKEDDKTPEEDASNSDSAAIDSVASSAEAKKADAKQAEQEQKRKEKIDQLVEDKKYYLPIVEGGHKASSQRLASWILLILLLAVVLVYLLIDAGYIKIGVSLPFDLIKN